MKSKEIHKGTEYFCNKCGSTVFIPKGTLHPYQFCPTCNCTGHKYKIVKKTPEIALKFKLEHTKKRSRKKQPLKNIPKIRKGNKSKCDLIYCKVCNKPFWRIKKGKRIPKTASYIKGPRIVTCGSECSKINLENNRKELRRRRNQK